MRTIKVYAKRIDTRALAVHRHASRLHNKLRRGCWTGTTGTDERWRRINGGVPAHAAQIFSGDTNHRRTRARVDRTRAPPAHLTLHHFRTPLFIFLLRFSVWFLVRGTRAPGHRVGPASK